MAIYSIAGKELDFVGIGKILINTDSLTWNMPHLHFLVYQNYEHFEAICLEFGLISSGPTQEEVTKRLFDHTIDYIEAVMNMGRGFDEFKEIATNHFADEYWAIYRHVEFLLAETKKDLSHEVESRITKAIRETFDAKIKEFIELKAKEKADDIIKEYQKMEAFKRSSVSYFSLEAAA